MEGRPAIPATYGRRHQDPQRPPLRTAPVSPVHLPALQESRKAGAMGSPLRLEAAPSTGSRMPVEHPGYAADSPAERPPKGQATGQQSSRVAERASKAPHGR